MPIVPNGQSPLYVQLKALLLERITSGQLPVGARVPSEHELQAEFGVSNTTVRRALLELQNEGAIFRHAGLGTFVAESTRKPRLLVVVSGYGAASWRRNGGAIIGQLIGGIGQVAWEHGAIVTMLHVPPQEALVDLLRSAISERTCDGVVLRLAGDIDEPSLRLLTTTRFPYAVVRRYLPGREISCVISDFREGARTATRHLLSLGHRRIGLILGPRAMAMFRDREQGYRRALEEAGLTYEPELVRWGRDYSELDGYRLGQHLLQLKNRPTAIFAANEMLSLGLARAARHAGVHVPDDLAIVGCDDSGLGEQMVPPLTAVSTSLYDIGIESARLVLEMIERGEFVPQTKLVSTSLIVRESCGATRRQAPGPGNVVHAVRRGTRRRSSA